MVAGKGMRTLTAALLAASMCAAAPAAAPAAAMARQDSAAQGQSTAAALAAASAAGDGESALAAADAGSSTLAAYAADNASSAAQGSSLTALQQKRIAILADNLVGRFAKGGTDASLDNNTMDAALALQQLAAASNGKLKASNLIDGTALLKTLKADTQANDGKHCGRLAKYLVGLNAAGVDVATYQSYVDSFVQQVPQALAAPAQGAYDGRVYNVVWILPALVAYAPDQTQLIEQAVAVLADKQAADGIIAGDCQTTAQAAWALGQAPASAGDATTQAQAAQSKALAALQNAQLDSGAWGYSASKPAANIDATGWAMWALSLAVAASDDNAATYASSCTKAAAYLQEVADAGLSHFREAALANETMASAAVLLGLSGATQAGAITLDSATFGAITGEYLALEKVTGVAATSKTKRKVKVAWANTNGVELAVDGYQVRIMSGSKVVKKVNVGVSVQVTHEQLVDGTERTRVKLIAPKKTTVNVASKYRGKKLKAAVRALRTKSAHRAAIYSAWSGVAKVKVK